MLPPRYEMSISQKLKLVGVNIFGGGAVASALSFPYFEIGGYFSQDLKDKAEFYDDGVLSLCSLVSCIVIARLLYKSFKSRTH